ncbi:MAG: hypothetical protein K2V38_27590, partial [Gemmataceae bacterium]|nr:hypothetical protein [Gemmataceae bacterium]
LKAYKKDGAQFGVIELTLTIVITEIELEEGQFLPVKEGSKVVMKSTHDTCIDGSRYFDDAKIEMTLDLSADIMGAGDMRLRVKATGTEKTYPAKK